MTDILVLYMFVDHKWLYIGTIGNSYFWRYDIQNNDTQHNDIQHNDSQQKRHNLGHSINVIQHN